MKRQLTSVALALGVMAAPAMAHTGAGAATGFMLGFLHPFGGLDHLLAMTAIGIWASYLGGRALWSVPAAFVGMMIAGAIFGAPGVAMPLVETGIALSVVALGALLAFKVQTPVAAGMALAGLFALMHGQAHGAEMPASGSGFLYGLGFCAATALLHATGVGLGLWTKPNVTRWVGAAVSAAGVALLAAG
jgi:urease accessory protein